MARTSVRSGLRIGIAICPNISSRPRRQVWPALVSSSAPDAMENTLVGAVSRRRTTSPDAAAGTPVHVPPLDEGFVFTQEGAVARTEAPGPRVPRERLGRIDWHNDLARLTLDISAAMEARADERSRAALVRRLRRALEEEPG